MPPKPQPDAGSRVKTVLGGAIQISARILSLLLGLALMAFLTRNLDVPEYGLYAVSVVLVNWVAVAVSGTTISTVVRLMAGHENGHRYAAAMLRLVAVCGLALAAFVAAAAQPAASIMHSPQAAPLLRILALDLALGTMAGTYAGILVAQGRFASAAIALVSAAASQLLAAWLLVGHGWKAEGACAAVVIGSAVHLVLGRMLSGISLFNRDRADLADLWGHTRLLAGGQLALRVSQSMDLPAVKYLERSAASAGLYAGAQNISFAAMLLFAPATSVVLQSMSGLRLAGHHGEAAATGSGFLRLGLAYGGLLCALSVLSPEIVALLLGPAFADTGPLLALLLWAVAFRILAMVGRTMVSVVGENASILTHLLILIVSGAAAYALVIPRAGMTGAAAVTVALAAAAGFTSLREGLRLMGLKFPWRSLVRIIVAGCVAAGVARLIPGEGAAVLGKLAMASSAYGLVLWALNEWRPGGAQFAMLASALRPGASARQ